MTAMLDSTSVFGSASGFASGSKNDYATSKVGTGIALNSEVRKRFGAVTQSLPPPPQPPKRLTKEERLEAAFRYKVESRAYPSGDVSVLNQTHPNFEHYLSRNPKARKMYKKSMNGKNHSKKNSWSLIGPKGNIVTNLEKDDYGVGRVDFITLHPTDIDTIYVGSIGSLWKSADAGSTWEILNNSVPTASCSDLGINPQNPEIMYLATGTPAWLVGATVHGTVAGGSPSFGVYSTKNGGKTWQPTGLGLLSVPYQINRLLVDPINPNVILVATTLGIYRSSDAGITWSIVFPYIVRDLQFQPNNSSVVYGAASVFIKSIDNGISWIGDPTDAPYLQINIPENPNIYQVGIQSPDWYVPGVVSGKLVVAEPLLANTPLMNPEAMNGNIALIQRGSVTFSEKVLNAQNAGAIGVVIFNLDGNDDIIIMGGIPTSSIPAVFISNSLGNSLKDLIESQSLVDITFSNLENPNIVSSPSRMKIGVTPIDPNVLYVIAVNGSQGLKGIYRSNDSGENFTEVLNGLGNNLLGRSLDSIDGQADYDLALAVSPINPDIVYTGGIFIYKTEDAFKSYTWIQNFDPALPSYTHVDIHNLVFRDANFLYTVTDGGVYVTSDGGEIFTNLNEGLSITEIYRIGISQNDSNLIALGCQDNGSALYSQENSPWQRINGGDGMNCFFDWSDDSTIYSSISLGRLFRSIKGNTYEIPPSGLFSEIFGDWLTPWLQDPANPKVLYAGYQIASSFFDDSNPSLFKSLDQGNNWTSTIIAEKGVVRDIAISPVNTQIIYAHLGNYSSRVFPINRLMKTVDGGSTWTDISLGLPVDLAFLTRIAVREKNANHVTVCFSGFSKKNKVFRSFDGGLTWLNYSRGLPNLPYNALVYDETSKVNGIYLAGDIGVYYRDDTLKKWQPYFLGLPNALNTDLHIMKKERLVRLGTGGRGVWEIPVYKKKCKPCKPCKPCYTYIPYKPCYTCKPCSCCSTPNYLDFLS